MRCRPVELIDHFIMKIRMVRFLRTPEFDTLFSGDPIWATEVIGGMGLDGRTLVTKNSFRYLHTLHTMGPAPEPNLTILWSKNCRSRSRNTPHRCRSSPPRCNTRTTI